MTLPPEDRDLIERVLGYDADENVKTLLLTRSDLSNLLAAARAEAAPVVDDGMARALIEPLYSADALASRDAEIERLRGELDSLRWAIMGGEDAPGVLDTVTHEEVLEALQESRSNWKSYAEMVAAECNRLSAALGEAERAINRAKEAVEDQDDIELVGSLDAALSTLKTAREG